MRVNVPLTYKQSLHRRVANILILSVLYRQFYMC